MQGLLLLAALSLTAAPDPDLDEPAPLSTDRPGNGNAATVVPPLTLQLETSFGYAFDVSTPDVHSLSLPTYLRFGALSWLELRLGSSLAGVTFVSGNTDIFGTDLIGGFKLGFLTHDGWRPDLALSVDVSFPVGGGAFTSGVVVPEARLLAGWGLPAGFSVLFNLGVDVPELGPDRVARLVYLGSFGYNIPKTEDRLLVFVDVFGKAPIGSDVEHLVQIDSGVMFLVTPNFQLDLFTQHALTAASPDLQLAVGASYRWPQ